MSNGPIMVDGMEVKVSGLFPRVARLHAEFYDYVQDHASFLPHLKQASVNADLFTFLAPIFTMVRSRVTWPSPARATFPFLRTARIVV